MIERLSLNSLKFFYQVAYCGSVTLAAQKLFVTQSAVSKQIRRLEDELQLKLFDRMNKRVVLTEQGKVLFACCEQVFSQLEGCLQHITTPKEPHHQLILSCEPTIAMKWLIPRLAEFNQRENDFEIVLLTAGGAIDFEQSRCDIALRRNDFIWDTTLYQKKISDEYMLTVQSPNYHPPQPEKVFISTSRPQLWQQVIQNTECFGLSGLKTPNLSDSPTVEKVTLEHFYLCIEAALAGLGKSVVSAFMVDKAVQSGTLQAVSPLVADGSSYHLLSATAFEADNRKLCFSNWLIAEMQKTLAIFG